MQTLLAELEWSIKALSGNGDPGERALHAAAIKDIVAAMTSLKQEGIQLS